MNNKLIQELREGKVAVKNDGSLNDLKKVLRYAFPKDDWFISGTPNYYYTDNCFYWKGWPNTDLPSYSVKEFLKEEEFVLPEKWCVKTTPNTRQLILDFIISKGYNSGGPLSYDYYLHFPLLSSKGSAYSYPKIGYTEITFEQFKKYVLKEEETMIDKINDEFIVDCLNNTDKERREVYKFLVDTRFYSKLYLSDSYSVIVCRKEEGDSNYSSLENAKNNNPLLPVLTFEEFKRKYLKEETMEKKIIGYKLIKPEYNDVAVKIAGYPNTAITINQALDVTVGTKYTHTSSREEYITKLKEAGVLDLWFEKVYEEEIKLPTINGYEGEIVGKTIKYGCAILNITMLKKVLETTRIVSPDGAGNRSIKAIVLDSGVEISIKDIEQIKKYLDAKGL